MSTPASACRRTTSATASATRRSSAAGSTGTPSSFANIIRIRSGGRGRLPVCVVRNPSVLRGVAIAPRCYHTVTGLPGRAERALHLGDPLLVTLVERPLLDPLGADESG